MKIKIKITFNRTIEELKFYLICFHKHFFQSFNRTIEELKYANFTPATVSF